MSFDIADIAFFLYEKLKKEAAGPRDVRYVPQKDGSQHILLGKISFVIKDEDSTYICINNLYDWFIIKLYLKSLIVNQDRLNSFISMVIDINEKINNTYYYFGKYRIEEKDARNKIEALGIKTYPKTHDSL